MSSFGLSNAWNDPSFVREKPYYEMAAAIGLPAARSNFAALYINDEYWGLYVLGEIVNGDFLKSHFAKGDDGGNLYKATDPGANLAYLGENPTSYQSLFSKESNEDANDWTDLIELARIFDQTPIADLPPNSTRLIDVDSFLTALALDNLTVNLDSYVGMAQNYYLYRRPSDHKWAWIPWDPSLAFGALAQGLTTQQMKDLALEWVQSTNTGGPGGGGGIGGASATRPIASKLWQVPAYKQRYRTIYRSIVEKQMIPVQVVARMNSLRKSHPSLCGEGHPKAGYDGPVRSRHDRRCHRRNRRWAGWGRRPAGWSTRLAAIHRRPCGVREGPARWTNTVAHLRRAGFTVLRADCGLYVAGFTESDAGAVRCRKERDLHRNRLRPVDHV